MRVAVLAAPIERAVSFGKFALFRLPRETALFIAAAQFRQERGAPFFVGGT